MFLTMKNSGGNERSTESSFMCNIICNSIHVVDILLTELNIVANILNESYIFLL